MRPSTPDSLRQSHADWELIKTKGGELAHYAEEMIEVISAKLLLLEFLLDQFKNHGLGMTLKHSKRDAWGIVLPDASEPGRFRWQAFQRDGFTGHSTHETPELCIGEMLDDGYVLLDMGVLDRLAATVEWQRGMEIVAVIQACNAGQMTFEEGTRKHEEILLRYQNAA